MPNTSINGVAKICFAKASCICTKTSLYLLFLPLSFRTSASCFVLTCHANERRESLLQLPLMALRVVQKQLVFPQKVFFTNIVNMHVNTGKKIRCAVAGNKHAAYLCGLLFFALFFCGCAKIPVQSVPLADALQAEGERMHQLNVVLLNRLFAQKHEEISRFIKEEYAPKAVARYLAAVDKSFPNTDYKKEFLPLMQAIAPQIDARRDSLTAVLELHKEKLASKLNADYQIFNNAALSLKMLLQSAVKVDQQKLALLNQVKALSGNRIDFSNIETELDKFIHSAGNVGSNAVDLNNFMNQMLDKK